MRLRGRAVEITDHNPGIVKTKNRMHVVTLHKYTFDCDSSNFIIITVLLLLLLLLLVNTTNLTRD